MNLPLIPQDKANHFIYGFVIYVISDLFLTPYYALGVVVFFAFAKETKDRWNGGEFDLKDLLVTLIPAIILTLKNQLL